MPRTGVRVNPPHLKGGLGGPRCLSRSEPKLDWGERSHSSSEPQRGTEETKSQLDLLKNPAPTLPHSSSFLLIYFFETPSISNAPECLHNPRLLCSPPFRVSQWSHSPPSRSLPGSANPTWKILAWLWRWIPTGEQLQEERKSGCFPLKCGLVESLPLVLSGGWFCLVWTCQNSDAA